MMESRRKSNVKSTFKKAINIYFSLSAFLIVLLVIFSKDLISFVIRTNFLEVNELIVPFFILISGGLLYGSKTILDSGINYSRKSYWHIYIYLFLMPLKFIIGYFLIPNFGIIGAALTSLLSIFLLVYISYLIGKRYFIIHFDKQYLLRILRYLLFVLPISFIFID